MWLELSVASRWKLHNFFCLGERNLSISLSAKITDLRKLAECALAGDNRGFRFALGQVSTACRIGMFMVRQIRLVLIVGPRHIYPAFVLMSSWKRLTDKSVLR
jgi:hypothetical protein